MRLASTSLGLLLIAALGCAVACGDDDDDTTPGNTAGSSSGGTSGNGGSAGEGGEPAAPMDSQLCLDLGGPTGIDAVVRGDGKSSASDPFNAYKFEKDGRQASVLLNVATDPCIGQQFAHLLDPAAAADLEHLAQCLSLFVQNAAGCDVAYDADSEGVPCKSMKAAHLGLGITEEDYTALINDAATALIAAGVDASSAQFKAVAGALTSDELKADVIEDDSAGYSQPGGMCEAGGAGPGAGGAGPGAGGAGGAGGAP
jgi:hypothetical protein